MPQSHSTHQSIKSKIKNQGDTPRHSFPLNPMGLTSKGTAERGKRTTYGAALRSLNFEAETFPVHDIGAKGGDPPPAGLAGGCLARPAQPKSQAGGRVHSASPPPRGAAAGPPPHSLQSQLDFRSEGATEQGLPQRLAYLSKSRRRMKRPAASGSATQRCLARGYMLSSSGLSRSRSAQVRLAGNQYRSSHRQPHSQATAAIFSLWSP